MTPAKSDPKKVAAETADKAKAEAQKRVGEAAEMGKKAFSAVGTEVGKVEKKIMALPVDRRTVFFAGLAVVILPFLGQLGIILLVILGIVMMYLSLTKKSMADLLHHEAPKKKS